MFVFEGITSENLPSAIEAMLFVTDDAVNPLTLASILDADVVEVRQALQKLAERYEQNNAGIRLLERAGGWRLVSSEAYHELLEAYVLSWDTRKLSRAALETLAIVAYFQPVTRANVSGIRGVSSDSSINSLIEKGLIREAGVDDTPGNPCLYATTRRFLEHFGLKTIKELPDLELFAPDEETRLLIAQRLGATRKEAEEFERKQAMRDLYGEDEAEEKASSSDNPLQISLSEYAQTKESNSTDSSEGEAFDSKLSAQSQDAMRKAMNDALAASVGVVEKINFSDLNFDD